MTNQLHFSLIKEGVDNWNGWRQENPEKQPDFSEANLSHANLIKVNLSQANLSGANLSGADLSGANLSGADLVEDHNLSVKFTQYKRDKLIARIGTAATGKGLEETKQYETEIIYRCVILSQANLSNANLIEADLSNANL